MASSPPCVLSSHSVRRLPWPRRGSRGAAQQCAALLQSGVEAGQGGRVGLIQLANARIERDQQCFRAADQLFGGGAAGAQRLVDPPRFGRQLLQSLRQSLIARQRRLFQGFEPSLGRADAVLQAAMQAGDQRALALDHVVDLMQPAFDIADRVGQPGHRLSLIHI